MAMTVADGAHFAEPREEGFGAAEVLTTSAKSKVFRSAELFGSANIRIRHRSVVRERVVLRGDLANINLGANCVVDADVVLRPSVRKFANGFKFCPIVVANNVYIGPASVVLGASIERNVYIGRGCVVGKRATIGECVVVDDGSVVPPDSNLAPYSRYGGQPVVRLGEVGPSFAALHEEWLRQKYDAVRCQ